jgi:hypothetical protein
MNGHLTPFRGFVHEQDEVANFVNFKGCAGNARFSQKIMGVKESGKVKASAGGIKAAGLVGELLLMVDPRTVERRLQLRHARLAQRRADVEPQNITKVIKFQDAG